MKAIEWSVLTAMSAGMAVVVLMVVVPGAGGLAGQDAVSDCAVGVWTPEMLRCGLGAALR